MAEHNGEGKYTNVHLLRCKRPRLHDAYDCNLDSIHLPGNVHYVEARQSRYVRVRAGPSKTEHAIKVDFDKPADCYRSRLGETLQCEVPVR